MIFKNKKLQSMISSLLIIAFLVPSLLAFSVPKKVEAGWPVFDWLGGALKVVGNLFIQSTAVSSATMASYGIKEWAEYILRLALQAVAKKALQQITKSTVNWINGGFHGSPLFLENSSSFFQDIVKSEVKTLVDQFGYDPNKFPFGRDFALNTINAYKRTLDNNASYTLSQAMNPIQATNFRNNFNVGGWNGFLINTQYPQNNYLGFQMLATEELARRVSSSPGANNAITKVKETLQQGAGFLSPQTCPSNSSYNNGYNEFNRPSFSSSSWSKSNPPPQQPVMGSDSGEPSTPAEQQMVDTYYENVNVWNDLKTTAEETWKQDNTCPKGLVATTPGSVVSSQITTALGSQFRSTELGAAMGNSLSAIFDALLNKLLDEGLNALASTINPQPSPDTWTYGGPNGPISLDSNGSGSSDPFAGFDEVVVLKDFKKLLDGYFIGTCTLPVENSGDTPVKQNDMPEAECNTAKGTWAKNPAGEDYIPGAIANTKEEIKLMDNTDVAQFPAINDVLNPGIIQLLKKIPVDIQALDMCLPGPDKGWEERLKLEQDRVSKPIQNEASGGNDPDNIDALKVKASNDAMRELKFAVDSFKDWVTTKMIGSLPNSIIYMDEIKKVEDYPQQLKEVTDTRRAKTETLARLRVIKKGLDGITKIDPSTGEPLDPTDEDKVISLWKQYRALRASISSAISIENTKSELNTLIIKSNNLSDPTTGLLVQCKNSRIAENWALFDITGKGNSVNINAAGQPYTEITIKTTPNRGEPTATDTTVITNKVTTGTELEQFCQLPIVNGYSHGEVIRQDSSNRALDGTYYKYTFRNPENPTEEKGSNGYGQPNLPMVNAQNILGDITCTGLCSGPILPFSSDPAGLQNSTDKRTSIIIDCSTLFKANKTDYTHAGDPSF